ncbi:hypothetical protein BABINDRAFT_22632, partial [Babjeviella inositovora NRRL Y-12698]
PAAPLALPTIDPGEFTKKFANMNILTTSFLSRDAKEKETPNDIAQKYAQLSLQMIDRKEEPVVLVKPEMSSNLSVRLARVLNTPISSDSALQELLRSLNDHFLKKIPTPKALNEYEYRDDYSTQTDYTPQDDSEDMLIRPGIVGSIHRRRLRSDLEDDLLNHHLSVLNTFKPLVAKLRTVEQNLQELERLHETSVADLSTSYTQLGGDEFHREILDLQRARRTVTFQKTLLASFQAKYTLNEYEQHVLGDLVPGSAMDPDAASSDEYFRVLAKAEDISENCAVLLSLDNPDLGMKIMARVNELIGSSLGKLVYSIERYFTGHSTALAASMKRALVVLQPHQQFRTVVDQLVDARTKVLTREFQAHLDGGDGEDNRPILLSAHDPLRFIGDLLAYAHSVIVNESETISGFFEADDSKGTLETHTETLSSIKYITVHVLNALGRLLKLRIEQLIKVEASLSTIYEIYGLLELYTLMFAKQLPALEDESLLDTLHGLQTVAQERIFGITKDKLAPVDTEHDGSMELLQPPEWIVDFYGSILPLIDRSTDETFMGFSPETNAQFVALVVQEPVDIFLKQTDAMVFPKKNSSVNRLILKLNFYDLVLSKILPIALLADSVFTISEEMGRCVTQLTALEFDVLLAESHLTDFYNLVNMICPFERDFFDVSIYEPIKENKLFTRETVAAVDRVLGEFLPMALTDVQQTPLLKLNSPTAANDIITNSSVEFINFYHKLQLLTVEFLGEGFTWNDAEVATLLGVEEAYKE